jgi:hypothetical protein
MCLYYNIVAAQSCLCSIVLNIKCWSPRTCFIGSSDLKRKKYIVVHNAVDNFYFGSAADLKRKKHCAIYMAVDNFYFFGQQMSPYRFRHAWSIELNQHKILSHAWLIVLHVIVCCHVPDQPCMTDQRHGIMLRAAMEIFCILASQLVDAFLDATLGPHP